MPLNCVPRLTLIPPPPPQFRFYRSLFYHIFHNRALRPTPAHLFSPVSTTTRSPFYECDLNLHKSNSTYFSDLDIARTHLICHLFKHSLRKRRSMYVALAGVSCLFRREIKPFEKYEVVNRVLGWDAKWVWVVSHFVQLGGQLEKSKDGKTPPQRKIFASALSKYVFKMGRITVKPEELLNECSLLPPRPVLTAEARTQTEDEVVVGALGKKMLDGKMSEEELLEQLDAAATGDVLDETGEYWTWERVEAERARGCAIAQCMLGLDQLEGEIRGGEEEGLAKVGNFF